MNVRASVPRSPMPHGPGKDDGCSSTPLRLATFDLTLPPRARDYMVFDQRSGVRRMYETRKPAGCAVTSVTRLAPARTAFAGNTTRHTPIRSGDEPGSHAAASRPFNRI